MVLRGIDVNQFPYIHSIFGDDTYLKICVDCSGKIFNSFKRWIFSNIAYYMGAAKTSFREINISLAN